MKTIAIIIASITFLFSGYALAGNFLEIRSEYVIPEDGAANYVATDNYYAYMVNDWDIGFEALTGDNEFWDFSAHCRYQALPGLYLGLKASTNSGNEERFTFTAVYGFDLNQPFKTLEKGKHFVRAAYTQELFNPDPLSDFWASYSHRYKKFRISAEAGYYFYGSNPEHLYLRPLRLGYFVTDSAMPFIMFQRSWIHDNDWRTESNSFFLGVDITW